MEQIMIYANGCQTIGALLMGACFVRIIVTIMTPHIPRPGRTYGATIFDE